MEPCWLARLRHVEEQAKVRLCSQVAGLDRDVLTRWLLPLPPSHCRHLV